MALLREAQAVNLFFGVHDPHPLVFHPGKIPENRKSAYSFLADQRHELGNALEAPRNYHDSANTYRSHSDHLANQETESRVVPQPGRGFLDRCQLLLDDYRVPECT